MPDRDIDDKTVRLMFHLGGWGFSLLATIWGIAILFQPRSRLSSPGWTVALGAPGGITFWGTWLLIAGGLMLLAMALKHRGKPLMLYASLAVSLALVGRAVAATMAMVDPTVSWTAPPTWFALACVYMAQGLIHAKAFAT